MQLATTSSAERVRLFRSRQSPERTEAEKDNGAQRKRMRRAQFSPDTVSSHRLQNTALQIRVRAERSPETVAYQSSQNTMSRSRLRADRSPDTIASQASQNTAGRSRLRADRSPVTVEARRVVDAADQNRRRAHHRETVATHLEALSSTNEFPVTSYLGKMDKVCLECQALHFAAELTGNDRDIYSTCCHKGAVNIPTVQHPPNFIAGLLNGNSNVSCPRLMETNDHVVLSR